MTAQQLIENVPQIRVVQTLRTDKAHRAFMGERMRASIDRQRERDMVAMYRMSDLESILRDKRNMAPDKVAARAERFINEHTLVSMDRDLVLLLREALGCLAAHFGDLTPTDQGDMMKFLYEESNGLLKLMNTEYQIQVQSAGPTQFRAAPAMAGIDINSITYLAPRLTALLEYYLGNIFRKRTQVVLQQPKSGGADSTLFEKMSLIRIFAFMKKNEPTERMASPEEELTRICAQTEQVANALGVLLTIMIATPETPLTTPLNELQEKIKVQLNDFK